MLSSGAPPWRGVRLPWVAALAGTARREAFGPSHLDPIFGLNRGFGGKCLPKDTLALGVLAESLGVKYDLMDAIQTDNSRLRSIVTGKESDVVTLDD